MKQILILTVMVISFVFLFACDVISGPKNEEETVTKYKLSGTLTSITSRSASPCDGYLAYIKLVTPGGASTDVPVFSAVSSAAFSSGTTTYTISGIKTGKYSIWAFVDRNSNVAATLYMPDSGDYMVNASAVIDMKGDKTFDIPDASWDRVL